MTPRRDRCLVLLSAGLDSAVLAAAEADHQVRLRGADAGRGLVHPVYVSAGLFWEAPELAALQTLLREPAFATLAPLERLVFSVADIYPASHWALRGEPPAYDTPDEAVYLTGRNIALLSKAAIYAAQHGIGRIVLGPLAGNPFPDATPQFFETMGRALSLGLDHPIAIDAPFSGMGKHEVIALGLALGVPLGLTLSCMRPDSGRHCGQCSKCRERRDAFDRAGAVDPASYATVP